MPFAELIVGDARPAPLTVVTALSVVGLTATCGRTGDTGPGTGSTFIHSRVALSMGSNSEGSRGRSGMRCTSPSTLLLSSWAYIRAWAFR